MLDYKSRNVYGAYQFEPLKWEILKLTLTFSLYIYHCSATKQGTSPSSAVAWGCAAMLPYMNMYCIIMEPEGVAAEKVNDQQILTVQKKKTEKHS